MDNSPQSPNQPIIDPDATSAELDRLAQIEDEAIKKAVALHPNTSPETLIKLFGEYGSLGNYYRCSPGEYLKLILKNPNLPLILLEQPDFFNRLLDLPNSKIYRSAKLPQFIIDLAPNHTKASIRSDISANYDIPINYLIKLAQDADSDVRSSLASNICMSDKVFKWLNNGKAIKRTVDRHPDAVYKMICQLAEDSAMKVRYVVANNSGTPAHIIEQLSFDLDENVLGAVARNGKSSETVLRRLFKHKSQLVAEALARNKNLPVDLMKIYAASDNKKVRYFIADNRSATVAILSKLANDRDGMIRQQVANNPNTSPHIIDCLAKEGIQKYTKIPF